MGIPDIDDLKEWGAPVWSRYGSHRQTIHVKAGAIRFEANGKAFVRTDIAEIVKAFVLPEARRKK